MAVTLQPNMVSTTQQPRVVVLTPVQSAMVTAALTKYGSRDTGKVEQPAAKKAMHEVDAREEQALSNEVSGQAYGGSQRSLGAQTLDASVMTMITSAIAQFESGGGGDFAQVMMAELEANGVDSTKSFIDFYA
ncbi:MAG: hypothetical protein ACU0BK_08095 [Shimia sp.]|uniref:hypothetical protein n=1 Tax=Shimia sp. TaxID=1954381 RepID=UPI004058D1F1